jgi:hypothetical protein
VGTVLSAPLLEAGFRVAHAHVFDKRAGGTGFAALPSAVPKAMLGASSRDGWFAGGTVNLPGGDWSAWVRFDSTARACCVQVDAGFPGKSLSRMPTSRPRGELPSARRYIFYPDSTFLLNRLRASSAINGVRCYLLAGARRRSSSKKFSRNVAWSEPLD